MSDADKKLLQNTLLLVGYSFMVAHHYRVSYWASETMAVIGGIITALGIIVALKR